VTPCNVVVGYRRFGGSRCHLHGEDEGIIVSYRNTIRRHNPEHLGEE